MIKIPASAIPVISDEARTILSATDKALLAHANMFAAVLETLGASGLPIATTQELYGCIAAHGGKLVDGRGDLQRIIAKLTAIKNRSDQKEVALGCPAGFPDIFEAVFSAVPPAPQAVQA